MDIVDGSVTLPLATSSSSYAPENFGEFRRLEQRIPSVISSRSIGIVSEDSKFWSKYHTVSTSRHHGLVKHVEFSPNKIQSPLAVVSSTRIDLLSSKTHARESSLSKFRDLVHTCSFRLDGKLIACGGEQCFIDVFDVDSRTQLRRLKGHSRAVHSIRFLRDKIHVASASDDRTVRLWDVSSSTCVSVFGEPSSESTVAQASNRPMFTDYVRTIDSSWADGGATIAAGCYDHSIRILDTRSGRGEVVQFFHDFAVERVLLHPSGNILYAAGSNEIRVYDIVSGRQEPLATLCNHQKDITCLALTSDHSRLVAGGLDHFLKIFDTTNFDVAHSMYYPAPILSVALSRDDANLVVGLSDSSIEWRVREIPASVVRAEARRKEYYRTGTYRYFMRGQNAKPSADDIRVEGVRRKRLAPYDQYLRRFQYHEALDAALNTRNVQTVCSVIDELNARGGLDIALSGRDDISVEPLLQFVVKYIVHPNFSSLLVGVASKLLDIYGEVVGQSVVVDELLFLLRRRLQQELALHHGLLSLQGMIEMLFSASVSMMEDSENQSEEEEVENLVRIADAVPPILSHPKIDGLSPQELDDPDMSMIAALSKHSDLSFEFTSFNLSPRVDAQSRAFSKEPSMSTTPIANGDKSKSSYSLPASAKRSRRRQIVICRDGDDVEDEDRVFETILDNSSIPLGNETPSMIPSLSSTASVSKAAKKTPKSAKGGKNRICTSQLSDSFLDDDSSTIDLDATLPFTDTTYAISEATPTRVTSPQTESRALSAPFTVDGSQPHKSRSRVRKRVVRKRSLASSQVESFHHEADSS